FRGFGGPQGLFGCETIIDHVATHLKVDPLIIRRLNIKRGITILPTKFGIGFAAKCFNQAGALVHIYKDGSVLLSHGGTEMGQGLHTKMISIAAEVLGCDVNRICISETATDKVPNTSPTAGSVSSDLNGMAIQIACVQIRERLDKILAENDGNLSWEDLIKKAYFSRIDLCAHGFYATPEPIGADFPNNRANILFLV
ncbi:unnamed protein product, partial [Rotaria sp. Silwood1]